MDYAVLTERNKVRLESMYCVFRVLYATNVAFPSLSEQHLTSVRTPDLRTVCPIARLATVTTTVLVVELGPLVFEQSSTAEVERKRVSPRVVPQWPATMPVGNTIVGQQAGWQLLEPLPTVPSVIKPVS